MVRWEIKVRLGSPPDSGDPLSRTRRQAPVYCEGSLLPVPQSRSISGLTAVLVIALGAAIGDRFGEDLGRLGGVAVGPAAYNESERFERALDLIATNLPDPVDSADAVYKGAIPGMLAVLDPHSQFFDPKAFNSLREEQRGSYAGVGMQIRSFRSQTIVDFPFPNTPAFQRGIRPGDVIKKIDDRPASELDVEGVADAVRGREGSTVHLTLARQGVESEIEVDLVRANIPRPTIPLAFEIEPGIGYVKITSFGETTANELDLALESLGEKDLSGMILDLRDNSGGLLTAGVHVAGRFLDEGAKVVSHSGRRSRSRDYESREGRRGPLYPMTVLVNCRSASASEIVAGALQDHDRALVAGAGTFGKGLVQSVFEMPQDTGMVLTTARYYTPSGRLIQRSYDDADLVRYYADPCSEGYEPEPNEVKLTDAGRRVYGGAGITPDVPLAGADLDDFQGQLVASRSFERFAASILDEIGPGWDPDDEDYQRFERFVQSESIIVEDGEFTRQRGFIRRMLRTAAYTAAFDVDQGARVNATLDPDVLQAVSLLSDAARLIESAEARALASQTAGERPAVAVP